MCLLVRLIDGYLPLPVTWQYHKHGNQDQYGFNI